MSEKQDSFTPRRTTSIDGFLSGPGQQPRRPAFRDGGPNAPQKKTGAQLPPVKGQASQQAPKFEGLQTRQNTPYVSENTLTSREGYSGTRSDGYIEPPRRRGGVGDEPKKTKCSLFGRRKKAEAEYAVKKGKKKHKARKLIFALIGLIILAFGVRFFADIMRLTGNNNPLSVLGALRDAPLKNDNGRVNILVAGNSADDLGHNGGELTDSIMVISVDTQKNTAMMLSVPRDMWVQLPAGGHGKINSVYPDSGMKGLATVIEDELGLPVHYNALVNYRAFKDLVDAVGGITITIKSEDPRGIYDPNLDYTSARCCALAKYPNGPVKLNGKQALNLARARGDGGGYGFPQGDFDRTQHQRQMLLAIKERASSPSVIANPVAISNLVSAVGSNAKTDLQLSEMQTLFKVMKKVDDSKIDSYNVNTLKGPGTTMLANYSAPGGQSALIPAAGIDDYSEIAAQIKKTFTSSPVAKEAAEVVVLNGTELPGLAKLESNKLDEKGLNVILKANGSTTTKTVIVDNTKGGKPATLKYLKQRYSTTVTTNTQLSTGYPNADIIILLGNDVATKYQNPQNGPQGYQAPTTTSGG